MILKLSTWLLVALGGGALVASCGSSSNSTSSSQTTPTAAATSPAAGGMTSTSATTTPSGPATTSSGPATTSSGPATRAGATNIPGTQQAVVTCKHSIQHVQPTISASAEAKLETICGKLASGDTAAKRKVVQEVCIELVNASQVPAGAAKQRALAICKTK